MAGVRKYVKAHPMCEGRLFYKSLKSIQLLRLFVDRNTETYRREKQRLYRVLAAMVAETPGIHY